MVKKKTSAARSVNKNYLDRYDRIILTQPLVRGTNMQQVYDKMDKGWKLTYQSTSVHHICPYDGVFRNCKECGALEEDFDVGFCMDKIEVVSSGALIERINDCKRAGLDVEFTNP